MSIFLRKVLRREPVKLREQLFLLHEYKHFSWEDMNKMYPYELDIINALIVKEKQRLDSQSNSNDVIKEEGWQ